MSSSYYYFLFLFMILVLNFVNVFLYYIYESEIVFLVMSALLGGLLAGFFIGYITPRY